MHERNERHIAKNLINIAVDYTTIEEQEALLEWAQELITVRNSSELSVLKKARTSIQITYRKEIIWKILKRLVSELKRLGWDDRSWAGRMGMGGAAFVLLAFGGSQGAGIAALGSAIGLPLWIVIGAGGTFAGALIDELQKLLQKKNP